MYCSTDHIIADALTKARHRAKLEYCFESIELVKFDNDQFICDWRLREFVGDNPVHTQTVKLEILDTLEAISCLFATTSVTLDSQELRCKIQPLKCSINQFQV